MWACPTAADGLVRALTEAVPEPARAARREVLSIAEVLAALEGDRRPQ